DSRSDRDGEHMRHQRLAAGHHLKRLRRFAYGLAGRLKPHQGLVGHGILTAFGDEADLPADRGGGQREGGERREGAEKAGKEWSHSAQLRREGIVAQRNCTICVAIRGEKRIMSNMHERGTGSAPEQTAARRVYRVYVSDAATAASIFEPTIKFPLLPSTTGRVEAVDPVHGVGEVGHDVRREACRGSAGNSW